MVPAGSSAPDPSLVLMLLPGKGNLPVRKTCPNPPAPGRELEEELALQRLQQHLIPLSSFC